MSFTNEPQNQLLLHFVDQNGIRSTSGYFLANTSIDPTSGGPAAIASAAQAISNAELSSVEILRHATDLAPADPEDGPYARHSDKAALTFTAGDGTTVQLEIGAPLATIFKSDKKNVNPADSDVDAFITYFLAHAKSAEGAALIGYQRGIRKRNSRIKKQ